MSVIEKRARVRAYGRTNLSWGELITLGERSNALYFVNLPCVRQTVLLTLFINLPAPLGSPSNLLYSPPPHPASRRVSDLYGCIMFFLTTRQRGRYYVNNVQAVLC